MFPIPDLMKARKVLCVQPHPDDNEWAAGGTIALLAGSGAEVVYVTVTDGRWGTTDPTLDPDRLVELRREEQVRAADLLGVSEIAWLDFPDGRTPPGSDPALVGPLVRLIRAYRPDGVLAPDPWMLYEAHPDHVNTGLAAATAVLFAGLPAAYREPELEAHSPELIAFYNTARPNTYVGIDGVWETKMAALAAHRSQFEVTWDMVRHYQKIQAEEAAARARDRGKAGADVALVEGFKVLAPLYLHCNWDAENW